MTHQHIVIIGAGPCGLGAAWQLKQLGVSSFHVYEAQGHVGGLASTIRDEKGFTWDIGGHVLHTTDASMKQFFLDLRGVEYKTYARNAFVFIDGMRFPYPIQHSVSSLPSKIQRTFVVAKQAIQKTKTIPTSFYDWILKQFGKELAAYFFFPYNRKMWKYPLTNMAWQWADIRIAKKEQQKKGETWGRNATFLVPTTGGVGAIWKAMAKELASHITLSKNVVSIDASSHVVTFQDGEQISYDHVLSTMPLPTLVQMVQKVSLPRVSPLVATGVSVVGLGMKGELPAYWKDVHWMYIPSPRIPFFRVSVYSNYGKHNRPDGTWSLLFERSYDGKKNFDERHCIDEVIRHAKNLGFIPKDTPIVDTFFTTRPFAYPVPTKNRDSSVARITTALASYNISSLGRFGSWNYENGNMDQVTKRGMEWARDMVNKI